MKGRMHHYLWIGFGGFVGSMGRYALTAALMHLSNARAFPLGTLAANLLGCLAIGVVARLLDLGEYHPNVRFFFVVGLLGGFTTFSSFSLEWLQLSSDGRGLGALLYVMLSLFGGLFLTLAGWKVVGLVRAL